MALEPMTPTVTDEANPELADMTRRFVFAIALTVPLFLLAMSDLLSGDPVGHLLSTRARTWIELALATPVCTYSAWPFYERFVLSLRTRHSTCSR